MDCFDGMGFHMEKVSWSKNYPSATVEMVSKNTELREYSVILITAFFFYDMNQKI